MRARLDGFLLDSFLFEFFVERFGEDSSRNGVPEAATRPHPEANCRWKGCVRRSKLGKAIANAIGAKPGMLRQCFDRRLRRRARNGPSACFRSGGSVILPGSGFNADERSPRPRCSLKLKQQTGCLRATADALDHRRTRRRRQRRVIRQTGGHPQAGHRSVPQ